MKRFLWHRARFLAGELGLRLCLQLWAAQVEVGLVEVGQPALGFALFPLVWVTDETTSTPHSYF